MKMIILNTNPINLKLNIILKNIKKVKSNHNTNNDFYTLLFRIKMVFE